MFLRNGKENISLFYSVLLSSALYVNKLLPYHYYIEDGNCGIFTAIHDCTLSYFVEHLHFNNMSSLSKYQISNKQRNFAKIEM